MARRSVVVGMIHAGCMLAVGTTAHAGVVSVNYWDVRAGYGVFADGGSMPVPDQGLEALPLGAASNLWQQTDAVAHSQAGIDSVVSLDQSGGRLDFQVSLTSQASASVGDEPGYTLEHATAQAYLDSVLLDITLHEAATLEVTGASLGGFAPGLHALQPGNYLLNLTDTGAMASVDVGVNQSATAAGAFQVGARIVPTPGGAWVLVLAGLVRRRRPRRA